LSELFNARRALNSQHHLRSTPSALNTICTED